MAYQIEWLVETEAELKVFSKGFRMTIKRKVEKIASNIPESLKLSSVQPIKGQEGLAIQGRIYELDIGSGARAAFVINVDKQTLTVYMVGTHDYAYENYLKLATKRLET